MVGILSLAQEAEVLLFALRCVSPHCRQPEPPAEFDWFARRLLSFVQLADEEDRTFPYRYSLLLASERAAKFGWKLGVGPDDEEDARARWIAQATEALRCLARPSHARQGSSRRTLLSSDVAETRH